MIHDKKTFLAGVVRLREAAPEFGTLTFVEVPAGNEHRPFTGAQLYTESSPAEITGGLGAFYLALTLEIGGNLSIYYRDNGTGDVAVVVNCYGPPGLAAQLEEAPDAPA